MVTGEKRRKGRRDKLVQRGAPPANPCPPGQRGGQYAPLSPDDIRRIYDAALELLATLGMGETPARLCADLRAAGASLAPNGRVTLPNGLVEDAIAGAAKRFTLHGRDATRSIEVGGDSVHFGTGGAAVQTLDLDTALYRPSTLRDLHDFTRLQNTLENVSWFTRCCIATVVPDNFDLDVNTAYALIRNTTKPVATAFTLAAHVAPIVEMLDIAAGAEGAFARRPFLKAHISPVISPMRFGEDAVDVLYACIAHNIPVSCITAAQSGATAPATLAGFLVQSLAETLASLVMVHAIRPGHPMIFSNWLGLPSGVACSMTDAKAIDAQYGVEKGLTAAAAGLAGGNLIYESSGMTASLLGASFEAFVLDNDMHAAIYRMLRGIEVTDEALSLDVISEAVLGDGHFLGADQTYQAMERDYHYPRLADRSTPGAWAEGGARDAWQRARERARDVLSSHNPDYLDAGQDAAIRSRFRILTPP